MVKSSIRSRKRGSSLRAGDAITTLSVPMDHWATSRRRPRSSSQPSPRGQLQPEPAPPPALARRQQCTNIPIGPVCGGQSVSGGRRQKMQSSC
jgi:hypothetical protein